MGWCTTLTSERIATVFGKIGKRQQPICAGIFLNFIPLLLKHQQSPNLPQSHLFVNRAHGSGSRSDADNSVLEQHSSPALFNNGPREKPWDQQWLFYGPFSYFTGDKPRLGFWSLAYKGVTVILSRDCHAPGSTRSKLLTWVTEIMQHSQRVF